MASRSFDPILNILRRNVEQSNLLSPKSLRKNARANVENALVWVNADSTAQQLAGRVVEACDAVADGYSRRLPIAQNESAFAAEREAAVTAIEALRMHLHDLPVSRRGEILGGN
ncbi:MAG: hypothetical protein M9955_17335 [Rhizobiaceae bacterium]|nr:hypothetical protein [Rhizobiaceae bacterium]